MTDRCVTCGKDIGIYLEFGGMPELQPVNADFDGFVCSNACKTRYDEKVRKEMDQLADPNVNLADWMGLPAEFRPFGEFPAED